MDSFFPSTVKQWLELPDHIRNASSISSFKSLLNSYFCRKRIINFSILGYVKKNIKYNTHVHCQLRNNASMLMADMYNHAWFNTNRNVC